AIADPEEPAALASSAHTYRLLVFKEHIAKQSHHINFRLASLRCQQQRNEIMKNVSAFVNKNFELPFSPIALGVIYRRSQHSTDTAFPASFALRRIAKERNSSD
ncbi:hypothetical protein, partial [Caballeronia hypogeia]|uniref:hypothetical protein n=1 Tax=Caballeronia hypogeia TaxID=1777140 RepID=UPI0012FD8FD2